MLDIETLGTQPGSAIISIGAVKFNDREVRDEFYERIDLESCINIGLKMQPQTVIWWLQQNDAARNEICQQGKPITEVLANFSKWVDDSNAEIWGNGATFDNVLLSCAYHAASLARPWKYSGDRCYRTLKNMFPNIEFARIGTHHNALDDAKSQAVHLIEILKQINE